MQLVQYLYVENNPIIYIDPSGESIAAAAGTVVVYAGKAFAVGLVAWLFTPSGKEAIDNASMLMADGIVYMGNEIPAFAYRVTSGVIGFVGQLIIETPSSFEPKEMLTGVVNGAKIAETVGYMAKVACEGKGESDSNTQSGKSDSESNSNRKQPSTSNSLGTPKGDGGNGGPPKGTPPITPPSELKFPNKQLGQKWGKHSKDYPTLKDYNDYRSLAQNVFENPEKILYDKNAGEFYFIKGADLLRTLEDGTFVSLYPGANSGRILGAIPIF